jgi:hypothetical protein
MLAASEIRGDSLAESSDATSSSSNPLDVPGFLETILSYVGPGHWYFLGAVSSFWSKTYAGMEGVQLLKKKGVDQASAVSRKRATALPWPLRVHSGVHMLVGLVASQRPSSKQQSSKLTCQPCWQHKSSACSSRRSRLQSSPRLQLSSSLCQSCSG